jgi:hypothetical protein
VKNYTEGFNRIKNKQNSVNSDIIVPLIANIIGGYSVGILYYLWMNNWTLLLTLSVFNQAVVYGIVFSSIFNIIRFFGDELKLFYLAFMIGKYSQSPPKEFIEDIKIDETELNKRNAIKLILAYYRKNMDITQSNAKNILSLTRKEYEDAKKVLINKHILGNMKTNKLIPSKEEDALRLIK